MRMIKKVAIIGIIFCAGIFLYTFMFHVYMKHKVENLPTNIRNIEIENDIDPQLFDVFKMCIILDNGNDIRAIGPFTKFHAFIYLQFSEYFWEYKYYLLSELHKNILSYMITEFSSVDEFNKFFYQKRLIVMYYLEHTFSFNELVYLYIQTSFGADKEKSIDEVSLDFFGKRVNQLNEKEMIILYLSTRLPYKKENGSEKYEKQIQKYLEGFNQGG